MEQTVAPITPQMNVRRDVIDKIRLLKNELNDMETIVNRYKEGEAWKKNITINEEEWNHIQEIIEASGELQDKVDYKVLIYDKYFKDYE